MTGGQKRGNGARDRFDDEKVRKDDVLARRQPMQSMDGTGLRIDEYKDIPTNRRPKSEEARLKNGNTKPADEDDEPKPTDTSHPVDRAGFDLGGSTGKTHAGSGLGLGNNAKEDRKRQRLPR